VLTPTKMQLYRRSDLVGWLLSEWRARAVLPHVAGNLMDLACGDNRLVKGYGSGVGVDIMGYGGVDVVCPDLGRLPFRDGEFDTVTILASLNYFDDPVSVLREVRRVLKPDGTVLVTLLNKTLSKLWHMVRERDTTPRPTLDDAELASCLGVAGMRVVSRKRFMLGLNTVYSIKR
jgi:SAM-dependent methyltransferase